MSSWRTGTPDRDEEEPGSVALRTAATAAELWQCLALYDLRGPTEARDAQSALRRLHGDGQPGAATTALALLTTRYWRRNSADLLRCLLSAGVLRDPDLDELAEVGLLEDVARVPVPASVFTGPTVVLSGGTVVKVLRVADEPGDVPDQGLLWMTRRLQPPLRRWAAAHVLRRNAARLDQVRERIRRLDARGAAAAMSGVLDAVAVLPPTQHAQVLQEALDWPHRSVRLRALRLLADAGQPEQARARAREDADASIRAAAPELSGATTLF